MAHRIYEILFSVFWGTSMMFICCVGLFLMSPLYWMNFSEFILWVLSTYPGKGIYLLFIFNSYLHILLNPFPWKAVTNAPGE